MPPLGTIAPSNVLKSQQEAPKKPKPSSLCYTPPALINDKKRDRSYFRRGLLGEGGFARCFEVTDFQGTRLAAKCIAKASITSEKTKMKLLGEIKVHKSMDHPNIVCQRDCFEDDVNVYMILDICTNGSLMDMLRARKRLTEPEIRYFGLQILGAAKYMHSRRVIHRDLKLGNLFLDENMVVKVGDFGLAALLIDDDDRKRTICGTPNYIAPEVLFGTSEGHSFEVDLWSIGIIFYAMLFGKPPFQSKDIKEIYQKIKANEYEFPTTREISLDIKDLIIKLLTTDPQKRPSIDDIANHAFFSQGFMPKNIPATARSRAPSWPAGQTTSIFRKNYQYVTQNAGIGRDSNTGGQQGEEVDAAVERPEAGHYLPSSLSPRTGPAPRMVETAPKPLGRSVETLSDRLRAVKMDANIPPTLSLAKQHLETRSSSRLSVARTASSSTLPLQEIERGVAPEFVRGVSNARLDKAERYGDLPVEVGRPSLSRAAARVASEPTRRIMGHFTEEDERQDHPRNLSRPIRRTASATIPTSVSDARSKQVEVPQTRSRSAALALTDTVKTVHSDEQDRPIRRPLRNPLTKTNGIGSLVASEESERGLWKAVEAIAENINQALRSGGRSALNLPPLAQKASSHYIAKWVDYSHKYGLGYQLSDGSTGVYFNDSTSIIMAPDQYHLDFISNGDRRGLTRASYTTDNHPEYLAKKTYLLKHFRGYMVQHLHQATEFPIYQEGHKATFLTHYLRNKNAILFRLSDKSIQFNFTDHSKLIIRDAGREIRYVDTDKEVCEWSLYDAVQHGEGRKKLEMASYILIKFASLEGGE